MDARRRRDSIGVVGDVARIPDDLVEAVLSARWLVVLTGAGVSAESGVPTFRDARTGVWAKHRPEDLATPQAFERDPALVSRWYDERRTRLAALKPNPGHMALVELQRWALRRDRGFTLLTQNVDRLHQAAGSVDVVELHGTLWVWRCVSCGVEREERGAALGAYPVRCECGGLRRPGVVWFGEMLPSQAMEAAERAIERCDLFLSIGTSAVVHPAAGFAQAAKASGARVAEINRDPTPISGLVDWCVQGKSGQTLPALMKAVREREAA